ncbi:MAG: DUF1207 domain-containing protein [Elusimicrobia bacterium]|nr:DUF1207 domain-containing protein [Elusimicrobiota bacterium]
MKRILAGACLAAGLGTAAAFGAQGARLGVFVPEMFFPSAREHFDPILADGTELGIGGRYLLPLSEDRFGEVSIGDYVGLARWRLGRQTRLQVNLGGGILSRFNFSTVKNSLEVTDFTAAAPFDLTLRGGHAVRFGFWHTSSHLGDDYILRVRPAIVKKSLDSLKAIYAFSPKDRWRAYGGGAYAFNTVGIQGRGALQFGLEYMGATRWGPGIRWYVAQDTQTWERVKWNPTYCLQSGLRFSDEKRIAAAKVYVEYFTGRQYFLQFNDVHETRWSFGVGFDIGNPIK